MKHKRVQDQVVVVFGASSGIGRASALAFAKAGARVVVASRGAAGLNSLVEEIQRGGGRAVAQVADAASYESVKAVAELAELAFGRIDTWVHAAGVYIVSRFEDITPDEFKHCLEVNTLGQIYGAKAALPYLKRNAQGGVLIHVSSIEAVRAFPFKAAYACSKHAIPGFLDALRMELKHDGIPVDVVNVMPAAINTPLFDKGLTKIGVKPFAPPPVYEPEIVARAIVRAAQKPQRDIIIGASGKFFVSGHKMMPAAMDALLRMGGFKGQKSREVKLASDPNAFWAPLEQDQRVRGSFEKAAMRHSTYTWLATRPLARAALALAGMGLLAWFGSGGARRRFAARLPAPGYR